MPRYCSLTPVAVRRLAHAWLGQAVPWKSYGRTVRPGDLVRLLLLMAAARLSLSAVAKRFAFGFSHETARQALRSVLPKPKDVDGLAGLAGTLGGALARAALLRRPRGRRRWRVAVDLHTVPFYGDRTAAGVSGGPKKAGTAYGFRYATAVVAERGRRFTVAVVPVAPRERPHTTLAAVLDQLATNGVPVGLVVVDRGLGAGDVINLLQERGLPYVVPLQRKGRGATGRNRWFAEPAGTLGRAEWNTDRGNRPVSTRVAVAAPRPDEDGPRVYAFGGWGGKEAGRAGRTVPEQAAAHYKARFGIETSYRQMNQAKAPTTSKDQAHRLLLVGVALLVRQAWVLLTAAPAAAAALPLVRLADWLGDAIEALHPERKTLTLRACLLHLEP